MSARAARTRASRTSHDQLAKSLLREGLAHLMQLANPRAARGLDFERRIDLEKEHFSDLPRGKRMEMDIVAQVGARRGPDRLVLILVESEEKDRRKGRAPFPERMAQYVVTLWLRYRLPVLPFVVYFGPGHQGIRRASYHVRALGVPVLDVHFQTVGVRGMSAERYLRGKNPLGWALAMRMNRGKLTPAQRRLWGERRLARGQVSETLQQFLLDYIDAYAALGPADEKEYQEQLEDPKNREVKELKMTWTEKIEHQARKKWHKEGIKEGRNEGRTEGRKEGAQAMAEAILKALEARSVPVDDVSRQRILACQDLATLQRWVVQAATATRIEDVLV